MESKCRLVALDGDAQESGIWCSNQPKSTTPGAQKIQNWPCSARSFSQKKCMPIAHDRRCLTVPLRMPFAVLLSVRSAVEGYVWPSSSKVLPRGTISCTLIYKAPTSYILDDLYNEKKSAIKDVFAGCLVT